MYGQNMPDQSGQTQIWVSREATTPEQTPKKKSFGKQQDSTTQNYQVNPWFAVTGQGMGPT